MIKVYFPPGCYGAYVSRCIHDYTNLRTKPFVDFTFDTSGSSHQFRHETQEELFNILRHGHIDNPYLAIDNANYTVVILPCKDHLLDYYNNQFFKQAEKHLDKFLIGQFSLEEITNKFKKYWNGVDAFDETVPRWVIREWASLYIGDLLDSQWVRYEEYTKLPATIKISTQDIFENWIETITQVVSVLDLTLTVDPDTIKKQHDAFLGLQKLHNSQIKCCQYVNNLINGLDTKMTLNTVFDEAYIQYLLRQHNLEIQCNGLDVFPATTQQLKTLTYETGNNSNS